MTWTTLREKLQPLVPSARMLAVWALGFALMDLWAVNGLLRISEHDGKVIGQLAQSAGQMFELFRDQNGVLKGIDGIIARQIVINEALMNEALRTRRGEKATANLAVLREQLTDSNKRIRELEAGRGDNSDKGLAVPLLQERVDSLRRELDSSVTQLRHEEEQSRSAIMWGVGLAFAAIIGILALIPLVMKLYKILSA